MLQSRATSVPLCRFHISFLRRLTSHYSGQLFVVVYKACRWPVGPDALLSIVRSAHEISDKNPDGLQNTCERGFSTEVECVVYRLNTAMVVSCPCVLW